MKPPIPHDLRSTPAVHNVLWAYANGWFPMAKSREDPSFFWVEPLRRGILPLEHVHLSRKLRRSLRAEVFEIRVDTQFDAVISGCAAPSHLRPDTWINAPIRALFRELFAAGYCHTVEAWKGGHLLGGLYGLALQGIFFGESMFHRQTDASKVCLLHLIARLRVGGFRVLDTQFHTPHLSQFGVIEIAQSGFRGFVDDALEISASFPDHCALRLSGNDVVQLLSQTSKTA